MKLVRVLTLLVVCGLALGSMAAYAAQPSLVLTSPAPYQVFQRRGGAADIPIRGTSSTSGTIEARFNGGAWQVIGHKGAGGAFSGVLANKPQGQGALEVRIAEAPDVTVAIPYVGIGDVFVIAGQSNANGYGDNLQTANHAWLKAGLFGNDYLWHELADPIDNSSGQVDLVSSDPETGGSVWPLVATYYLNSLNLPVAFVPAAKSGRPIAEWMSGRDHADRATLYGSMVYRARLTGAKAVLWWQGETDALNGMAQADYGTQFRQLAAAIGRDLGIPIMPCLIQNSMGIADDNEAAIRRAVVEAASAANNVILGPDLSDLATDDQYHLRSDANLQAAADRWWQALQGLAG